MRDMSGDPYGLLPSGPISGPDEYRLFSTGYEASEILSAAGIPHLAGGGLAVRAYGRRRPTKDVDLFLPPKLPLVALDSLGRQGFHTRETDAGWLYKAFKHGVLIDLIVWTTGNLRVDDETFARSRRQTVDGWSFPLMGPEDVLLRKILSHREERRDWYDGLSMLDPPSASFDFGYFLRPLRLDALERVLSFFLYARSELGRSAIPAFLMAGLVQQLPYAGSYHAQ